MHRRRYFWLAGLLLLLLVLACGCWKHGSRTERPPNPAETEKLPGPAELNKRAYASLEKGVYFEGKATVEGAGTVKVRGWAGKDQESRFCSRVESWDDQGHRCTVWFRSAKGESPGLLVLKDANTGETRSTELANDGAAIFIYGGPAIFPNWGWYEQKGSEKVGSTLCVVLERPNGLKAWVRPSDGLPLKAAGPYTKGRRAVFEATRMERAEVPPGTFDIPRQERG